MPDANNDASDGVAGALAALTGCKGAALLLAVSGGPDSMAMLDMVRRSWAGPVFAATVDHRLRPESADEAAMVAAFCANLAIGHRILTSDTPITGSVQAAARALRYRLLGDEAARVGADFIVTAHHADDQLETLLMRLARGSGVDGLSGVRARNGQVIRPMLGFRKADLERYCTAKAIPFLHDPSNANPDFARVRMREALQRFDLIDPLMAARSASALADAAEALDWIAAREAKSVVQIASGEVTLTCTSYPAGVLRRLVQHCLGEIQPGIAPRGDALDRLIATLQSGGQGMIGEILCRGGAAWHFMPAPARRKGASTANATE
jgi:tRNA(Ile)-lysidine synthase